MPLNPLLGAGRDPQVRNAIQNYRISQTNIGIGSASNFPGTTESLSLNPAERVFSIQIKIFPSSTGASIDSARFRVRINQYVIADYKLPNNDAWISNVDETLAVDLITDEISTLFVEYGPELGDASGYNIGFSVVVYSITV